MSCSDMISIIVPIYNVKKYLEKCINSIINQSYHNIELILVDDGSTDGCSDIIDKFAKSDSRIVAVHKKNGGLSSARNAGIEIARGAYLGFVDSDDYISLNMYSIMMEKIIKYRADICICSRYYEYENGKKILRYKLDDQDKVMSSKDAIVEMNSFKSFDMAAWDKLYKAELFREIRFPEGKLSEDFFVMYKLFLQADKLVYVPQPLYYYQQRQGSISRNKKINFDFIEAAEKQMLDVEGVYPDIKNILKTAFASANMTVYNFHLKNKVTCSEQMLKRMQDAVSNNCDAVMQNRQLNMIKKIQAYLFIHNIHIYNLMFSLYKIFDKI